MRTWTRRLPGWEAALTAYVEQYRHHPFQWGQHDCLLFGVGAVRAITGADPIGDRYIYRDPETAAALLRDDGHASLQDCVTAHLGAPIRHLQAGRGDLALVDVSGVRALGVVLGERIACPGPDSLAFVPLDAAVACWRI